MSAESAARSIVLRQTVRKAVRSGAVWGALFGFVAASSAASYVGIYKTPAERAHLATAFGSNTAMSALFGPAPGLDTVAGFTVFKSLLTLMILAAIWGLLTGTRLLRGEEEAGRWDLLLAGRTTPARATAQSLAAVAAGVAVMWGVCAVILTAAGQRGDIDLSPSGCAYFALAAVAAAAMFGALGACTSQLAATRRQAAAYAAWFLGAAYAVRVVADAGVGLHGLVWISPLGWVEELHPFTAPRPLPLVPIGAFTLLFAVLAVHLASTRDVGASLLPDRDRRAARTRLLSGHVGLAVRLERPTLVAWAVALGLTGLLLGLVAKPAAATMEGSSVSTVLSRLGAGGAGSRAFLGVAFLIVAVLAAFLAAGQVTAARTEEAQGRLDHLLVGPVARMRWVLGRFVLAAAAVVVGAVLAGLLAWLGGVSQGFGVGSATVLAAGLNAVPPALLLLGAGWLVLGLWPRSTGFAVYGVLAWSLLLEVAGGFGTASRWLLDSSVFHHMAAAPAVQPNWRVGGLMVLVGAAFAVAGALALGRRDLRAD